MAKIRVRIKTDFGEISFEGSPEEVKTLVGEFPSVVKCVEAHNIPLIKPKFEKPVEPELKIQQMGILAGVIEFTKDGIPQIVAPLGNLTAKEIIGIILYANYPTGLSLGKLTEVISRNWKSVSQGYITANLSQMKEFVLKEGSRGSYIYTLTGKGRNWVEEDVIKRLKGEGK